MASYLLPLLMQARLYLVTRSGFRAQGPPLEFPPVMVFTPKLMLLVATFQHFWKQSSIRQINGCVWEAWVDLVSDNIKFLKRRFHHGVTSYWLHSVVHGNYVNWKFSVVQF